jgi:predicted RNA-binding protein YlqC (UPF0109 family)
LNPEPRTSQENKIFIDCSAENAKVRMDLSLARVDGGHLMALRGETANGERRASTMRQKKPAAKKFPA